MDDQLQHYQNKLAFEIDSWDLKVALEAGENVIVIDARSADAYAAEHIPGALNIPHRQMSADSTPALDKSALVVTYCDGIGCNLYQRRTGHGPAGLSRQRAHGWLGLVEA